MKIKTKRSTSRLLILSGICLLALAAVAFVVWQGSIATAQQKAVNYVHTIRGLIPDPQGAVVEERRDNTMSVLSVGGKDFSGIIET